ncbi:MAG: hypothetical protein GY754_36825 [bacterium]|nr:hypothetical protein [bacterium]
MNQKINIKCSCNGCISSEKSGEGQGLPYRYRSGLGQNIFSYTMFLSIAVLGTLFIWFSSGATWMLFVPGISLVATYIFNSFFLCSSCSYHHEGVLMCGCAPKSIFPFKRNKAWGNFDNIFGWSLAVGIYCGGPMVVLADSQSWPFMVMFSMYIVIYLLLQSIVSCPNCRQRNVCYLGKTALYFRK